MSKQLYIDELRRRHGDSPALRELERRYIKPEPQIDPEIMAKQATSSYLADEMGFDVNAVNASYDSIVEAKYGAKMSPSAVLERMEQDGIVLRPQSQSKFLEMDILEALEGKAPTEEEQAALERRKLVKSTADYFSYLDKSENYIDRTQRPLLADKPESARMANVPVSVRDIIESKPSRPGEVFSEEPYTEDDLLDISTFTGLLKDTKSKEQAEELYSQRRIAVQNHKAAIMEQQEQAVMRMAASKADTNAFFEFYKGLESGAQAVKKGLASASVAMGMGWNAQGVQEAKDAMARIEMTPSEAAGVLGYVANTVGQTLPYFATMAVGGMGTTFLTEFGNAYGDAIDAGMTEAEAQIEGIAIGLPVTYIESLQLEKWFKFAKAGKTSFVSFRNAVKNKMYKEIVKSGGRFIGEGMKLALNEGIEEVLQEGVQLTVPAITRGDYPQTPDGKVDWSAIGENLTGAFTGGAIGGLFLGGAGKVFNAAQIVDAKKNLAAVIAIRESMPYEEAQEKTNEMFARREEGLPFNELYQSVVNPEIYQEYLTQKETLKEAAEQGTEGEQQAGGTMAGVAPEAVQMDAQEAEAPPQQPTGEDQGGKVADATPKVANATSKVAYETGEVDNATPKVASATQDVASKEPWEMTKDEYRDSKSLVPAIRDTTSGKVYVGTRGDIHATIAMRASEEGVGLEKVESGWWDGDKYIEYGDAKKYQGEMDARNMWSKLEREHRAAVTIAVAYGKPVPQSVLTEYPDLQGKQPLDTPAPSVDNTPMSKDLSGLSGKQREQVEYWLTQKGPTELYRDKKGNILLAEQTDVGLFQSTIDTDGNYESIGHEPVDTKRWTPIPDSATIPPMSKDTAARDIAPQDTASGKGEIVEAEGVEFPLNDDGTVTVYHRTDQTAEQIRKTGWQTKEAGKIYVGNKSDGQISGYGKNVIELRVKPEDLSIDDEFPSGEAHFTIKPKVANKAISSFNPPAAKEGGKNHKEAGFLSNTPFGDKDAFYRKMLEVVENLPPKEDPLRKAIDANRASNPATDQQKARAHIIQNEDQISDDEYRSIAEMVTGKTSTKDMTVYEAERFINTLRPQKKSLGKAFYEENAGKGRIPISEKVNLDNIKLEVTKATRTMSDRLRLISPKLFHKVKRDFIFKSLHRTSEMVERARPFVEGMEKISKENGEVFDIASLIGEPATDDIMDIIVRNGLEKEYNEARKVLDEIYEMAFIVGMDIDYRPMYFPRKVKDFDGLMKYLERTEYYSIIETALRNREASAGRELTKEEQSHIVGTLLRGYKTNQVSLATPGNVKAREIAIIDKNIFPYYHNWKRSLADYIHGMNVNIAARQFFGKESREVAKLRGQISRAKNRVAQFEAGTVKAKDGETFRARKKKAVEKLMQLEQDFQKKNLNFLNDSIGAIVLEERTAGRITPNQEKELRGIFEGIFSPKGPHGWMQTLIKAGYVSTLSQVTNALTQAGELVYSLLKDPIRGSINYAKAWAGRSNIKLNENTGGLGNVQEWTDAGFDKWARRMLAMMTTVNDKGFEAFINTAIEKDAKLARKNPAKLKKRLDWIFGPQSESVMLDLLAGNITENVKYLAFAELSEIQPISIMEMPEYYAKGGNLRVFYMLKTFTIKRINVIWNTARNDMESGEPGRVLRGLSRATWLVFWLLMADTAVDAIKDLIRGKPFNPADAVIDNMLQMIMLSKYDLNQLSSEGVGGTMGNIVSLPTPFSDAIIKDMVTLFDENSEKGSELARRAPYVGEFYYWWVGEGARKIDKGYYDN